MGLCGSTPKGPDYAASAREGVYAELETSPFTYLINAVAKTGGRIELDGQTYDFTGLGDADNARVTAEKMAQALLDMQQKYGADYVRQRLAELQASDPDGQTARKQLYEATMASLDAPINEQNYKVQELLLDRLGRGAQLDPETTRQVQQNVRGVQAARGNIRGNAAVAQEARAVTAAGEQQRSASQQQAADFLAAGLDPTDVEYRRIQQGMANLGAFLGGETPTAQFGQLSGAQGGAAPFIGGGPNAVQINPNAGVQGAQQAQNQFAIQSSYDRTQANPFLAGASLGLQAYGAYQQMPRVGGAVGPATYTAPTWAGAYNQWD